MRAFSMVAGATTLILLGSGCGEVLAVDGQQPADAGPTSSDPGGATDEGSSREDAGCTDCTVAPPQVCPAGTVAPACTPCAQGTFSDVVDAIECHSWTTCAAGTFVQSAGTATTDQVCADCAPTETSTTTNAARCSAYPVKITGGADHACALMSDHTVACWGSNAYGQLGTGMKVGHLVPTAVPDLSGVVSVEAGDAHTCALLDDDSVKCWGYNAFGQLGDGSFVSRTAPTTVPGLHAHAISLGRRTTCAVITDGSLSCWGDGSSGLFLGDNSPRTSASPIAVPAIAGTLASLSLGESHRCVVADGDAACWGDNGSRQLGSDPGMPTFAPVHSVTNISAIAAGVYDSCALGEDGTVACWGNDFYDQLGGPARGPYPAEVEGISHATAIAIGTYHACAIVDEAALCWGRNEDGELGIGTTTRSNAAASTLGFGSVDSIVAHGASTYAITTGHVAYVWGANASGQLGDGTTTSHSKPTAIAF